MFDQFSVRSNSRPVRLSVVALGSFVVASVMLGTAPLRAAGCTWGVPSGDWSVASNWGGAVPSTTSNGYVINGGTASITSSDAVCNSLYLGDPNSTNTGTIQMSGGSLSVSSHEYLGNKGTGTFLQSGGTNNLGSNGCLYLGFTSSGGSYNLSGSGVLNADVEYVGNVGTSTFNQSSGTNIVKAGFTLGGAGTYNLTGGALLVPGILGSGTFNLGGGTLVANNGFSTGQAITLTGSGGNGNINTGGYAVTLSGYLTGPGGLNNIGGGILTLSSYSAADTYRATRRFLRVHSRRLPRIPRSATSATRVASSSIMAAPSWPRAMTTRS